MAVEGVPDWQAPLIMCSLFADLCRAVSPAVVVGGRLSGNDGIICQDIEGAAVRFCVPMVATTASVIRLTVSPCGSAFAALKNEPGSEATEAS